MFLRCLTSCLLAIVASSAAADGPPVPKSSQGYWVPASASCKSELGVRVAATSAEFVNMRQRKLFRTQACFSCEGGARYSGAVIWVSPSAAGSPEFTIYLNAEEQAGVAKVEIESAALRAAFPLDKVTLKRCEM